MSQEWETDVAIQCGLAYSQGSCKERGAREGWNLVVILIYVFNPFVALLVFMEQETPGKAVNNKPMINCPF